MVNMSRSSIFFNRSYVEKSFPAGEKTTDKKTMLLNGVFVNTLSQMYLAVPDVTPLCLESLQFMSDDYSCAVLWISCPYPGLSSWYELRVRNTSITTGPRQECLQNFRE
ncbi:hypothetical protein V5799_000212 [Amblyomma americanum]|uniref:Uncharacterized protein n=1 Tax=Amblyomma americanum TaxID=6943 RepID=A0AAQ4D3P7_AMBAM